MATSSEVALINGNYAMGMKKPFSKSLAARVAKGSLNWGALAARVVLPLLIKWLTDVARNRKKE